MMTDAVALWELLASATAVDTLPNHRERMAKPIWLKNVNRYKNYPRSTAMKEAPSGITKEWQRSPCS